MLPHIMRSSVNWRPYIVMAPTSDPSIIPALSAAYSDSGITTFFGVNNFFNSNIKIDIMHIHWPEELFGWSAPTDQQIELGEKKIKEWKSRTKIVATVHNLPPHCGWTKNMKLWFSIIYQNSHMITHFSNYSYVEFIKEFPNLSSSLHLVHNPHTFRAAPFDRRVSREHLGLGEDDFSILVLGQIRHESELSLILKSFRHARIDHKQISIICRLPGSKGWRGAITRRFLRLKVQGHSVFGSIQFDEKYVEDIKMSILLGGSDALFIYRQPPQINSGLLSLGMEAGLPIVAPDYGAFSEYLSTGENELFVPGDGYSAGEALSRIFLKCNNKLARISLSNDNRNISKKWGWGQVIDSVTSRLSA